jgi:hypothetical protein
VRKVSLPLILLALFVIAAAVSAFFVPTKAALGLIGAAIVLIAAGAAALGRQL